jgi:Protein of unknown function (DUF1089).
MPSGHYVVLGENGEPVGSEDFRCAPGPIGWRYFSDIKTIEPMPHDEIVDIAVDAAWRPVRLRIETGAHRLLLQADGTRLSGYRDGAAIETAWSEEMHLDYFSPSFNAITCRRLSETTEIEVVFIQPFTLEPVMQRQRYELLGNEEVETKVGRFAAKKWRYTSLRDGWTALLWSAADIVVRYESLFELTDYEPGASGVSPTVSSHLGPHP